MNYTHAFFDLDGTLTDSAPGIINSVCYALRKLGIEPPAKESLTCFIGPPLAWSFSTYFRMSEEESRRAVDAYREYYRAGGMLENNVYDGVSELLKRLTEAGIVCVVATSKPHIFANRILKHFSLDGYFKLVAGPELDGTRGEKHEVIAYAMEQLGLPADTRILMIGDREHDVHGAKLCGIDSAGVLWGFGSEQELRSAGATHVCATTDELAGLLLQNPPSLSFFQKPLDELTKIHYNSIDGI